jgi:hypothetical protein
MVMRHVLAHGLIFAFIANAYLFLVMISTTPRVWGYTDYPLAIKNKVPPQTRREKRKALLIGLPWFIFVLGFFPILDLFAQVQAGERDFFLDRFFQSGRHGSAGHAGRPGSPGLACCQQDHSPIRDHPGLGEGRL